MKTQVYVGTSGWHYADWLGLFYPPEVTGYKELSYHAQHFNTVENNSSFYRIAKESTYKTWFRMTPDAYKFSMKLNKFVTHTHRLALLDEVQEKVRYVLHTTQILQQKLGVLVIQLPPSFVYDVQRLRTFLEFLTGEIRVLEHKFGLAIEFRHKKWFTEEVYTLLRTYNVALVAGQSSRYPEMRQITADLAYIRMHGPEKLFASVYTKAQLEELATYIRSIASQVKHVYVYFNNDFHGYALKNAQQLSAMLHL